MKNLVRNYYTLHNSFDGIEEYVKEVKDWDIDQLYDCIGFKRYANHTAKEMYECVKISKERGEYDIIKDYTEMSRLAPKSRTPKRMFNIEEINLITSLVETDEIYTKGEYPLCTMLQSLGMTSNQEFDKTIKDKTIVKNLIKKLPKIVYKKDLKEPVIIGNILYTGNKIPNAKMETFYKNVLKNIARNESKVNSGSFYKYQSMCEKPMDLDEVHYWEIALEAIENNMTIEELLRYCNVPTINFIDQYKKYNCYFYQLGEYVYIHIPKREGTKIHTVNGFVFNDLIRKGLVNKIAEDENILKVK